jgi:predicted ATPase/predicted Ser/Thr protein kinase
METRRGAEGSPLMRRTRISDLEHLRLLASDSWSPCEALVKAFEDAWRRGDAPALADFVRADGPERQALLVELAHADLEFRLRAGEAVRVERYLAAYPELASSRAALPGLVAAEYELRRLGGEEVGPDEYRRRFPGHAADLFDWLGLAVEDTVAPAGRGAPTDVRAGPEVPGYELLGELGRGGMGVVYKARDAALGRHVALKFLPPEYAGDPDRLDRFRREARTASGLNHPHICTVHALGEHAGRPFIVMEFVEGRTLQELIARRPDPREIVRLAGQVARALAAAHAAGVVHRDVKPENVMVRPDGYVKVLDFGLARRLPTLPGPGRDSNPGALVGTVAYMSPEQARGETADGASDVFSLGIVLYQLATGRHPFQAESSLATLHAIASRPPAPPDRLNPELPAALAGLIEAMLHKDARLRPTAAAVETALAAAEGPRATAGPPRAVVHREPELAVLRAALADADAGLGSLVCVAGEPGIGKTTLVEDFLEGAGAAVPPRLVARGRCSERLAGSEAYLPVLDALQSLVRDDPTGTAAGLLKVCAPTWYARVVPGGPDAGATAPTPAFSQHGLLREFDAFLRELTRLEPVVLFFDDVHWADVSTVDLLAHFGQNCRGKRVLAVLTYRPTELLLGPHPFYRVKLELQSKGACAELALGFLGRPDIDRYLALAFPGHAFPPDFARLVHARTEGSPLFLAELLRYLRDRGVLADRGGGWALARELPDLTHELPESVRGMIERKLDWLGDGDRRLLAAASVQGHVFDAAVVAGALGLDEADVEERLQVLDRVHGLVRLVREQEFPDHTLTRRYAFVHMLYQQALYADLPPSRRAALSTALAELLGARHGEDNPAVAAELGCLFEVGRNPGRAAWQFWLAAQGAARVFAHREAVELARRGLRLLAALPATPARAALELPLQTTLGLQLQVTDGYAATAAREAYLRARELCPRDGADDGTLFPVLWGLWLFHKVRSELARAGELADDLLALARGLNDPALAIQAHQALGITAFCRGEPAAALRHVEQVAALYDPGRHHTHAYLFGQDPAVICKAYGAVALWLLGYPESAERESDAAVARGRQLSPTSQAVALFFAAMLHQLRRDAPRTRACADAACALAAEHGFSFWLAGNHILGGWAQAVLGEPGAGLDRLRRGLVGWQATGSVTYQTYYLGLLAEVLAATGQAGDARRKLDEALDLASQTGEGLYEAEVLRLRGELRRRAADEGAVADFDAALDLARRQEGRSFALRAATSGARLRPSAPARDRLAELVATFTEGRLSPDLHDARALLDGMG